MRKLLIYETGYGIRNEKSGVTNSITTKLDDVVIEEREITDTDYREMVAGKKTIHDILSKYEKGSSVKTGEGGSKGASEEGSSNSKPDTTGQPRLRVSTSSGTDTERIRRVKSGRKD